MKKIKRRVLLDTNVWSEVAKLDSDGALFKAARSTSTEILVAPTVVQEIRGIPDVVRRQRALKMVARPTWTRLMPETYEECLELKAEIIRLRPEWKIDQPKFEEQFRLRFDWTRRTGGYWDRARLDLSPPITDESLRSDIELQLARDEAQAIRRRTFASGKNGGTTHLQYIGFVPEVTTPGWSGKPVDYWRAASLAFFRKELMIFASPYREWMDNEIDVFAMLADSESMNHLWFHELNPKNVPRQWMRGAFEFLAAWHKVTSGTPGDCTLSTYLLEADHVVSADKNFVEFANRCSAEAPFVTAKGVLVKGGDAGFKELLTFIAGGPSVHGGTDGGPNLCVSEKN